MILADTSAWVEYDRATGSPADLRLTELIGSGHSLTVTQPVVMEVAAGARTEQQESELRLLLGQYRLLSFDADVDFDAATLIYRRCRRVGITPHGLIDCMIAAVAWRTGATLLAHDLDLDRVATEVGIAMDDASLRA